MKTTFNTYEFVFRLFAALILFFPCRPGVRFVDARVSVGLFPANPFPERIIAATLAGLPSSIVIYHNWTIEEAVQGMLLTSGYGATAALQSLNPGQFEYLVRAAVESQQKPNAFANNALNHSYISIPMKVGDNPVMMTSFFDGDFPISVNSMNATENIKELIRNQFKLRKLHVVRQLALFGPVLAGSELVQDSIFEGVDTGGWCDSFSHQFLFSADDKGKLGPRKRPMTTTQLVIQYALDRDIFPTFVVNLWYNTVRREFMHRQLQSSGLSPAYLMPGVDVLMLPQVVMKALLADDVVMLRGHFAVAIAQLQVWREVLHNDLPYALVLEDDVDLHPQIKQVLRLVLPSLPDKWSLLYLDRSILEMYWSTVQTNNSTPDLCSHVLNATNQRVIKLDGLCSAASSRSYVLSRHGAKILTSHMLPIRMPPDVLFQHLTEEGTIDAYVLNPGLASATRSMEDRQITQINHRTIKVDRAFYEMAVNANETNPLLDRSGNAYPPSPVVITHAPGDEIDCNTELCTIIIRDGRIV